MTTHDYDIGIFETAALVDAFDLAEYGRAYSTAEHLAEYLVAHENADDSFHDGIIQMLWQWYHECIRPTPAMWEYITESWRADDEHAGLIEWAAFADPTPFVEQTFRIARAMLFGV